MGCGSSSAAGIASGSGSTMTKDQDDFHLDQVAFKKMKVPEFDTYLCDQLEPTMNKVIDIINDINGYIDDIKDAASIILGGFKVDIQLEGSNEYDKVLLQLTKAAGPVLTVDEAKKLAENAAVVEADAALIKARKALYAETAASYVALKVQGDVLTSDAPPASLSAFNTALAALRSAVGADFKVVLIVKTAGAGGSPCASFDLSKPVFADIMHSDKYDLEPVTALDVAKSKEAKNIFAAEQAVADALAALTKTVKDAEGAGITTTFSLKKKKLVPAFEGGEGDDVADKTSAVRKAVSSANSQLFKLFKAARNANAGVDIAKALVAVLESLKKKVLFLSKGGDIAKLVVINPKISVTADGDFSFDLGLKVNLPDFESLTDWEEILRKLLPGPAQIVLDTILALKAKIIEVIPDFKSLADELLETAKQAEEVFAEPQEKIKAAFGEDAGYGAVLAAGAAAAGNLKTCASEPPKIVSVMKETLLRVNDELQAGVTEVKTLFAAATA